MRAFACPRCQALVFFDNSTCLTCGATLVYDRNTHTFQDLDRGTGGLSPCANRPVIGCNWSAPAAGLCGSCVLTRTRPASADSPAMSAWADTEAAKRALVAQLDTLGLPLSPRVPDAGGLAFDLLSSAEEKVITGHANGVITLDLAEGDDAHREAVRVSLQEPYRTVLGHLRHEIGHYYWPRLAEGDPRFRELFGDESADYSEALAAHYGHADDHSWTDTHVSRYAAAHPWEDWAETFAQYLHIRDVLDTAAAWGVRVDGPGVALATAPDAPLEADPGTAVADFEDLIRTWLPLSFALNAINRSMGSSDLYPYLLVPAVLTKLNYVHQSVTACLAQDRPRS
jgi:hypothetical protein